MKKIILVVFLSIGFMTIGVYLGIHNLYDHEPADGKRTLTNSPILHQLQLPDVDKQLRNGKEWQDKIVIVNHWATWCAPCREEIPMLINYQQQIGNKNVQVVGIAHDLLDPTRRFSDEIGINYPSLLSITGSAQLLASHGNTNSGALPYTVIFDQNGNIANSHLGLLNTDQLHAMVSPLL